MSALPPSDAHDPEGSGSARGGPAPTEAVFFLNGAPSEAVNRLSDAILRARPGLLYIYASG